MLLIALSGPINHYVTIGNHDRTNPAMAPNSLIEMNISPVANNYNQSEASVLSSALVRGINIASSGYNTTRIHNNAVVNISINYPVDEDPAVNIGNDVTITLSYSIIQVNVTGDMVRLLMSINETHNNISDVSVVKSTIPSPDPPFIKAYYKYSPNYKAIPVVMTIGASALSVYSIAGIVDLSGQVVAKEDGTIEAFDPEFTPILPEITAAVAADFAYLHGYALIHGYPTVYIDTGASIGTQWVNFFRIGAYGEEGVFTGDYNNKSSGYYLLILTTGGSESYQIHSGVWNPGAEPPW